MAKMKVESGEEIDIYRIERTDNWRMQINNPNTKIFAGFIARLHFSSEDMEKFMDIIKNEQSRIDSSPKTRKRGPIPLYKGRLNGGYDK